MKPQGASSISVFWTLRVLFQADLVVERLQTFGDQRSTSVILVVRIVHVALRS